MKFKPMVCRENFDEWELESMFNTKYDTYRPMGMVASSQMSEVVCAWLVGLDESIFPMISRLLKWLECVIVDDKKYDTNHNFYCQQLHQAKALGLWLQDGKNYVEVWNQTRLFSDAALKEGGLCTKAQIPTLWLTDHMIYCYQSGNYSAGIEAFEKYHGAKIINLKRTLKPRDYVYALCLQNIHQPFNEAELLVAGQKMLQSNLEKEWLGMGQYVRAAIWLKIVYWHHTPSLTPLQTILKAYDHLPDVPKHDLDTIFTIKI